MILTVAGSLRQYCVNEPHGRCEVRGRGAESGGVAVAMPGLLGGTRVSAERARSGVCAAGSMPSGPYPPLSPPALEPPVSPPLPTAGALGASSPARTASTDWRSALAG